MQGSFKQINYTQKLKKGTKTMKKLDINVNGLLAELNSIKQNKNKKVNELTVRNNELVLVSALSDTLEISRNTDNVTGDGEFTVDFYKFYNALNELKTVGENGTIEIDDTIIIDVDYVSIELETQNIYNDYKFDKEVINNQALIEIKDVQEFIKIIETQRTFSAEKEDQIPVITGVKAELTKDNLRLIGIDGFRFVTTDYPINNDSEFELILSRDFSNLLLKLLRNNKKNIKQARLIDYKGSFVGIRIELDNDSIELTGRKLDGNFFDYTSIIPKDYNHEITLNTDKLKKSINIVQNCGHRAYDEYHTMIIFNKYTNDSVVINDHYKWVKSKFDNVNDIDNSENLFFALNARFLQDAIKNIKQDKVTLKFTYGRCYGGGKDVHTPIVISDKNENYTNNYYVLPIRVQDYTMELDVA